MKRFAVTCVIAMLLVGTVPLHAQGQAGLYNEGNRAYAAGDFEKAVSLYEKAAAAGAHNHLLYHNLGNAYFKQGNLGLAILNYERALKLDPGDEDTRFNLRFARTATVDQIEAPERTLVEKAFDAADRSVSLPTAVHLAVALYLLLCTCGLLAVVWRKRPGARNAALWAGAGVLLLCLIAAPVVAVKVHRDVAVTSGVLLADQVEVRSGPGEKYTTVFTIHEGTLLHVIETRGAWAQVRIESGFAGWLPADSFEAI